MTPSSSTAGTISWSIPQSAFDYGTPNAHVLVATASGSYTVDPTTGAISGSVTTTGTGNSARIYSRTGACTSTGTSECGPIATTINFSGTFTGNTTTMVGSATLSGSGTLSAFGCVAPFSAINGKTLTVSSMAVTLT